MRIHDFEFLTHSIQSEFSELRQQYMAERHGIQNRVVELKSKLLRIHSHKSRIK